LHIFFFYIFKSTLFLLSLVSGYSVFSSDADTSQGLYVAEENLGIHDNAQLVVLSDLYLQNATILGSGTLTLQTSTATKIISKNSKVNNLKINEKNQVDLKGDLHIIFTLILDQTIFVTGQDSLTTEANAKATLVNEAKIIQKTVPQRTASHLTFYTAILNQPLVLCFRYYKNLVYIASAAKNPEEFQLPQFQPPKYLENILKHKIFNKRINYN
jgi:hypothetical protein